ncbi:Fe(3+)-hydroxamate ABC transporter permease FhuB [Palleronia sp.]|uniref:Fe(3+)-hydroxamate ABC transporter permease FhuB n=1 Tax=Palleronia sp. TaxID=1940284 RepID=UPI0035C826DE
MTARHPLTGGLLALPVLLFAHLLTSTDLPADRIIALAFAAPPEGFAEVRFLYASLPRAAMAVIAGIALGVAGSLMQQVTQNRLASPLTLGAASGAWLATVAATLVAPAYTAAHGGWISMAGATLAFVLVVGITGLRGLAGLQAVLGGMAVNLVFGAIAGALVLLESPYFAHLFVWGAGDLGQNGWNWVTWSLPRVAAGLAVAACLGRLLALLRLGAEAAEGRGMALASGLVIAMGVGLFLTATAVTAVGLVGFIGLIAPNIARRLGARTPIGELLASGAWGALLLLFADALAVGLNLVARDLIPTGATAALMGAPALIVLMRRQLHAADHAVYTLPVGPARPSVARLATLVLGTALLAAAALTVAPGELGWRIGLPNELIWSLRWPRLLVALAAGVGMALSGLVLQRLIRNPLASPDILGMSSGATFALVATAMVAGVSVHEIGPVVALGGALAVLVLLLLLSRRHHHAPATVALTGISLAALLDALVKVALATGSQDSFAVLTWMGGSTYRANPATALTLSAVVGIIGIGLWLVRRWLTLIAAGDPVALARGVPVRVVRPALMAIAAALAAAVVAAMGPVGFVGLLSPHIAAMLGARRAADQLALSALVGGALMIASDWIGRTALHPMQLPAGTVASLLGGVYFLALVVRRRGLSS